LYLQGEMGRYKRKTERRNFFTNEILRQIKDKINSGQSKRSVAREFNIHEATLRKRLKEDSIPTSLGRFKPVFSQELEERLVEHVKKLDSLFYGVTLRDLRRAAFDYAEGNKLTHRFDKTAKLAGKDWTNQFRKKHNLSLRQPEKTSIARAMGFNRVQVDLFFNNLRRMYEKYKFNPQQIYNMDETGLLTVPNKLPKVVSVKGKKQVGKIVSGERGQLITAVCAISASGNFVLPTLIFPRKRQKPDLLHGAPPGTIQQVSDSGFINTELFEEWLIHFKKTVPSGEDNPILLILDNHTSHISINELKYCRENHIHLLSLPPHTSRKLQPLDVDVYSSLKQAYSQEADTWQVNHPGRAITQYQIAEIFGNAYKRIATVAKAIQSFKDTGISPFNPNIFTEEDFAPATVTDREVPNENVEATDHDNVEEIDAFQAEYPEHHTPENSQLADSPSQDENEDEEQSDANVMITQTVEASTLDNLRVVENVSIEVDLQILNDLNLPSTSKENILFVKPKDIVPLPKAVGNPNARKRKNKKCEILTSSSLYYDALSRKNTQTPSKEKKEALKSNKKTKKTKENKVQIMKDVGICPGCTEYYDDPPEIDLIQCWKCVKWWHEECTSYIGIGKFKCDLC
jgi:hypothetical protein